MPLVDTCVGPAQLFWHKKELEDGVEGTMTLAQMNLHTGFALSGYDLRSPPHYFPPVALVEDANGRHLEIAPDQFLGEPQPEGHVQGYFPGYNDHLEPLAS